MSDSSPLTELSSLPDSDFDTTDEETHLSDDSEVVEPPAKRRKGKERAVDNHTPSPEPPRIVKPSTTDWTDIPVWQAGQGSPLMEMPAEILDKIFCVRPELELRDYVSLAGTCNFFRHHMTDDFWQSLVRDRDPQYRSDGVLSLAVETPFSRTVPDWRVPHPHHMLPVDDYPVVIRRADSQWDDTSTGYPAGQQLAYLHGHYVPRGPRSSWTYSQYTTYKEEQATWRECRDLHRLQGLETMFSELCESARRNEERKRVNIDPCKHIFFDVIKEYPGRVDPITSEWRLSEKSNGIRGASVSSHSTSRSVEVEDGQLATTTCTALATTEADEPTWSDEWEAPDSEASEPENEFEWLWNRGAKVEHDHWPSEWRTIAVRLVTDSCLGKQAAMRVYAVNEKELKTLKGFKVRTSYGHPILKRRSRPRIQRVYCRAAIKARAFKLHGGAAAHDAYLEAITEPRRPLIPAFQKAT